MARNWVTFGALFAATLGFLAAPSVKAASLQLVSNWGGSGMPSDVSMYIYVPDKVATNPPILTLVHYCGGTASAVFGQAQGGGVVGAADQYGFVMVVPSSGRCWDVVSDKTRTRDGYGDSHAIRQMVRYAVDTYKANADRVYVTGDSSGGMMTELLLALYPDVFKAGAAFAGMPAGCRAANESGSGGGYSGACAAGSVTHTPQEWGDIVRTMDPGYAGHRPRVQLFHGDGDTTIRYTNHTEAIKEWTNVLGLSTDPTSTNTGVQLGNHQAKRQGWQNSCGYVVLDAFTSIGGDHGPSDALFKAQYVIPFLGLDKTGPVDPEIEQCGDDDGDGGDGGDSSISINAGGSATGSFVADSYYSGGNKYSTTKTIDTSLITGTAPPMAVFQTERYGEFTYTIPNRTAGSAQAVTLYFEESYWSAAGKRTFDVSINGVVLLRAFDIFAAAGGASKAIARTFSTTANSSGQVVIQFARNGGPDNPKICGITLEGTPAAGTN